MSTSLVESLAASVRTAYARIHAVDPATPLAKFVTEPAALFAVTQVINGGALAHNTATVAALRVALGELNDAFHLELAG